MKNPHKALEAIERLAGGDFAMDMEWYLATNQSTTKVWLKKQLRQAAKIIGTIYIISHAEGRCKGHPSWDGRKYEVLKEFAEE